ncbi:MAG TPA: S8 family peptidase [Chloroflexota bacterium]|nr:S8 family peptidase [Chloroflexota bacterium]
MGCCATHALRRARKPYRRGVLLVIALAIAPLAAQRGEMRALAGEVHAAIVPNDDLYDQYQWNLRQIHAPEAWDLTTGSSTVVIAILDTGVSLTHPDLVRKLVPGHNFLNDASQPDDDHGNGTHVAGIAAADTNNHAGIAGIAWQARIMPVKVLDANARGDPSIAARGVTWAVDHGANIINLGLTGPDPSPDLEAAIDYAHSQGVTVIAPVANDGADAVTYPAAFPHVIAVGATGRDDQRLSTSDTGSYISVSAPGEQIASTFKSPDGQDGYAVASSTAQAAAHVSGVAALLLAINPNLTPSDIRSILESSADDVGPPGRDAETGAGRINAARAVLFASPWNFVPSGAGAYTAASTSTNSLYFPLVEKDVNGWSTSFTVQNTSGKSVNLTIELFDMDGKLVLSFPSSIGANGSATYQPAQLAGLPSGFNGSAAIYADGPIDGLVNQDQAGRDRLTYEGVSGGARGVWVPYLARSSDGWSTGLRVQNIGGVPTRVHVVYTSTDSSAPTADAMVSIPAFGSATLFQPAEDRLPDGWVGAAYVDSLDDQLLAVVVNAVSASGANASYSVFGSPGPVAYAPLIFRNGASWVTDVRVQNASSVPTTLAVSYNSAASPGERWVAQRPLDSNAAAPISEPTDAQLPSPFAGSGTFRAIGGGQLQGVAATVNPTGDEGMAYQLPVDGSQTIALPLLYRGFAGWNSGVRIQNIGSRPTTVDLSLYQQDGTLVAALQEELDAGAARTFFLPDIDAVPPFFVGSAIATSSDSVPIVGIVNSVK